MMVDGEGPGAAEIEGLGDVSELLAKKDGTNPDCSEQASTTSNKNQSEVGASSATSR